MSEVALIDASLLPLMVIVAEAERAAAEGNPIDRDLLAAYLWAGVELLLRPLPCANRATALQP
jgi:hypothetical protein